MYFIKTGYLQVGTLDRQIIYVSKVHASLRVLLSLFVIPGSASSHCTSSHLTSP